MKTLSIIVVLLATLTSCQKPEEVNCYECYKESFVNNVSTGTKTLYEGCMTESEIFSLHPKQEINNPEFNQVIVYDCKIK